jgi:hypothetical protein
MGGQRTFWPLSSLSYKGVRVQVQEIFDTMHALLL